MRTKEPRADKVQEVSELNSIITSANTTILTSFNNLSVKDASNLRKKLREADASFRVVKNKLFNLAAQGTAIEELTKDLAGPTALVSTKTDPVAAAKAIMDFARESKGMISVKSACVDGQIIDANGVQALSTIPPKPVLLAQVVGGLQAPITGLAGTLQSMLSQLVMTLQAVADKQAA